MALGLKRIIMALFIACALCFASTANAHAASKPVVVEKGKYYTVYKLNRQQTQRLAKGAAITAVIFGASRSWVAVPTGLTAWWAQRVVDNGKCVYVRIGTWPKAWSGNCS